MERPFWAAPGFLPLPNAREGDVAPFGARREGERVSPASFNATVDHPQLE